MMIAAINMLCRRWLPTGTIDEAYPCGGKVRNHHNHTNDMAQQVSSRRRVPPVVELTLGLHCFPLDRRRSAQ